MNIHPPINALVSAVLGWLPIEQLLLFKDTIMAYKCVNNLAPNYLCDKFRKQSELHDHPMRYQDLLNTPSIYNCSRTDNVSIHRNKTLEQFRK